GSLLVVLASSSSGAMAGPIAIRSADAFSRTANESAPSLAMVARARLWSFSGRMRLRKNSTRAGVSVCNLASFRVASSSSGCPARTGAADRPAHRARTQKYVNRRMVIALDKAGEEARSIFPSIIETRTSERGPSAACGLAVLSRKRPKGSEGEDPMSEDQHEKSAASKGPVRLVERQGSGKKTGIHEQHPESLVH